MNTHRNALLTPKGRARLVAQIARMGLLHAAAGISARSARKWQRRFDDQGASGLLERSSRPRRSPRRSDPDKIGRAVALRRTQRLSYAQIAERVGLSRSTVARARQHAGLTSRSRSRNKDSPASKTDPDVRPRRKGNAASQARLMERAPMENRSGRIVDTVLTRAGEQSRTQSRQRHDRQTRSGQCRCTQRAGRRQER